MASVAVVPSATPESAKTEVTPSATPRAVSAPENELAAARTAGGSFATGEAIRRSCRASGEALPLESMATTRISWMPPGSVMRVPASVVAVARSIDQVPSAPTSTS